MKLKIKTCPPLRGQEFLLEVAEDDKISCVRGKVSERLGTETFAAEQLILVAKGAVLKEDDTLKSKGIDAAGFVAVTAKKPAAPAQAAAAPNVEARGEKRKAKTTGSLLFLARGPTKRKVICVGSEDPIQELLNECAAVCKGGLEEGDLMLKTGTPLKTIDLGSDLQLPVSTLGLEDQAVIIVLSVNASGPGGGAALQGDVKAMDFKGKCIGDRGAVELAQRLRDGQYPSLEKILLVKQRISDEGAMALARAMRSGACASLELLSLEDNYIRDKGTLSLVGAIRGGKCPRFGCLAIDGNQHGEDGRKALEALNESSPQIRVWYGSGDYD